LKAAARPAIGRATSSSANAPGLCSSCMSVSHADRAKTRLSGFLVGVGDVRIAHDSHLRIRTRPASVAPGGGGRLCRLGQSGAVHRRLRRRVGPYGGGVFAGGGESDGASRLCAGRPSEALHLRLSEPGAVEPPAGARSPSQHRGYLAAAQPETGLQDHRRLPARQSRGVSRRVSPIRVAVPAPRPVRPRVAGGRRNPHQGGQQQGSQFHPLFAPRVHPPRRRAVGRLPQAARRGRRRGWRDRGRRAHEELGRKDLRR